MNSSKDFKNVIQKVYQEVVNSKNGKVPDYFLDLV